MAAAETGLLSEPHFHLRSAAEAEQGGPLFLDLCNDGHLLHDPDGLAARFMAEHSQWLRAQRELAFYGDVEWIPTERHGPLEGERALAAAREALDLAELVIAGP